MNEETYFKMIDNLIEKMLWVQAFSNYAANNNCLNPHQAEIFADDGVKAFNKRFSSKKARKK